METKRPEVGMGATYCCGSDYYAYDIIEVRTEKEIVVRRCKTIVTKPAATYGDTVEFAFEADPNGATETVILRKNGRWVAKGRSLKDFGFGIGYRREYRDPSF